MSSTELDISQLVSKTHKYALTASNESPEDAILRREQEGADANQKRNIALVLFLFSIFMVGVFFIGGVYYFATGGPEDKKWAAGIVSAIASGLIGFLVGQTRK